MVGCMHETSVRISTPKPLLDYVIWTERSSWPRTLRAVSVWKRDEPSFRMKMEMGFVFWSQTELTREGFNQISLLAVNFTRTRPSFAVILCGLRD
jgi:hypothetical protein